MVITNTFMRNRFAIAAFVFLTIAFAIVLADRPAIAEKILKVGSVTVHSATTVDLSPPLGSLSPKKSDIPALGCKANPSGCGTSPEPEEEADEDQPPQITQSGQNAQRPSPPPAIPPAPPPIPPAGLAVEQRTQGSRPAAATVASFDGMGFGFNGPQGQTRPAGLDNSLAVGPNHIVQVINGAGIAVYTKKGVQFDVTGRVLYGAVPSRTVFKDFGGACEAANFGDVVVRYDQLADRWLYVMPIFQRIAGRPEEPYSVCYALSQGADPLGSYHRYEFRRKLFPDYPRPAIWPDGYYVPTSTGDNIIQKHVCIVDRSAMLQGKPATEQCLIIDGVNFLNNADIDGMNLPPAGAPNIMMAAGGTQLKPPISTKQILEDDGIYVWKVHVDWQDFSKTAAAGPVKIPVAPYHYLCSGQLTNCVPQPGVTTRLDAQGDKLMQRLIYRNFGDHESMVVTHSVNSSPGAAGGVRWYEFRMNPKGDPTLFQQGTYAPDESYRWMASAGMDRMGNIGIGYSFGGISNFVGQRFAARMAGDPLGQLSVQETILVEGKGVQTRGNRWEDYTTTAMDPADNCTFWYVGNYYKEGAAALTTKIGGFRLNGCLHRTLSGSAFYDRNHNGKRDEGEPGLPGVQVAYAGLNSGKVKTALNGSFSVSLPADPLYGSASYTVSSEPSSRSGWTQTSKTLTLSLVDGAIASVDFGNACTEPNGGGAPPKFWQGGKGKAILNANFPAWSDLINSRFPLNLPGTASSAYDQFKKWLDKPSISTQLAALTLNIGFGRQSSKVFVQDRLKGDWLSIESLIVRIAEQNPAAAENSRPLVERLNGNKEPVTPPGPAGCPVF